MKLLTGLLASAYVLLLILVLWPFLEHPGSVNNLGHQMLGIVFLGVTLATVLWPIHRTIMKIVMWANAVLSLIVIIGFPVQTILGEESFWSVTEIVVAMFLLGVVPAFTAAQIRERLKVV